MGTALKALCGEFIKFDLRLSDADNTGRDHVTEYWPTKNTKGAMIMDMYVRIVRKAETDEAAQNNGAAGGASNGTATAPSNGTS